jgi:energy-coupling factor transport system ATP-binding protein
MSTLIDIESISFAYRDPQGKTYPVLQDISLKIEEGELAAIVGANGSGKTTLIRHLNGLLMPDSGRVLVAGHDTRSAAGRKAIHQLVGMVFQHPEDQIISSTLEDEVAFGPENLGLPPAEIEERVAETLQAVDLWQDRERPPHLLSAGQTQRLALAGVLAMRPRCIIFDEATTMLDPEGRRMALDWMLRLNSQGITILYVTHHMEEAAMARRVVVFQNGRVSLDGTPRQVFADPSRLAALGLELPPAAALAERLRPYLPGLPPGILTAQELLAALGGGNRLSEEASFPVSPGSPPDPLIEVSQLSHTYLSGTPLAHPSLIEVNLAVAAGASHGLLGRTGSGKSTLLQHLNGLLRPQHGSVRVGNFNLADPAVLTRSVIQMVGLVFQNPEMQFFEQFVGDEIAYGPRQFPAAEPLAQRVRLAMELVGLDFEAFKDRLLYTLSGGERRKVALASVLALHPAILLLDEPTAGLDPHSHTEILQRLKELQAGGMTLVLSSHRMEDLAELAQNLSLFDAGRVPICGPLPEVFGSRTALEAAGLEQPLAVQAAGCLRARGWLLPPGVVTPAQLSVALAAGPRPAEGPAQLGQASAGETLTSGKAAA